MTYDEALQEIGVAPGSGQDEIRRAYLRLVKIRKPESDPEGFRRLREAFERLRELPEHALEIRLDPPVPVAPVAAAAVSEVDAFAPDLEEQLAEIEQEDDLSPDQAGRAADAVLQALRTAGERGDFPPPFPIVRLLLRLQAQGHAAEAARVQEAFQSFLGSSGQELALLSGWTAVFWQVAQEMLRLSPEFPAAARAAIGEAVAAGAPENAIPELDRAVEEDGDVGWRMASELKELPGLHGLYHQAVLAALARRSPPVDPEISSPWHAGELGRWIFGGFWVLFFLIRNCSPSAPPAPSMSPSTLPIPSIASPVDLDSVRFGSLADPLARACPSGQVPSLGQSVFCRAARDAASHLQRRRCYDARATRGQLLEGLQMLQGSAFVPPAETLIAAIRAEYSVVCQDDAF